MVHNQMIATNIIHPPVQLKKKKTLESKNDIFWPIKIIAPSTSFYITI